VGPGPSDRKGEDDMFNLDKFIADSVTKRPVSMFSDL